MASSSGGSLRGDSRDHARQSQSVDLSLGRADMYQVGDDEATSDLRRAETPIAIAVRKQGGPSFREVTIELPFNDAGYLETTIVYPLTQHEPSNPLARSSNSIAILLHPWSRAGGNANDPTLLSYVALFLKRDFHVIVYNSRGVGNSGGSATFSGLGEAQDLQVVVDLALREIECVEEVVLLGYSYGSLAASHHPSRPPTLFSASTLARNPHTSPNLRIRHILLSYPIGVLWLLTMFRTSSYTAKLHELVTSPGADVLVLYGEKDQFTKKEKYVRWVEELKDAHEKALPREDSDVSEHSNLNPNPTPSPTPTLSPTTITASPTTSKAQSLDRSRDSISPSPSRSVPPVPAPRLTVHAVPPADHFWRSSSVSRQAHALVGTWLDDRVPLSPNVTARSRLSPQTATASG